MESTVFKMHIAFVFLGEGLTGIYLNPKGNEITETTDLG